MLSNLQIHSSDPIAQALRSQMKGEFLNAFSTLDKSLDDKWPGAQMVVYGSTLMRQLSLTEGVVFPLGGMKSSDVDIGVVEGNGNSSEEVYTSRLKEHVAPLIRDAIAQCGFAYLSHKPMTGVVSSQVEKTDDVLNLNTEKFIGDFYLTRVFTPEEIDTKISGHPHYEQLRSMVPSEPMEVMLVIGVNDKPIPLLLDPVDTFPESGEGSFKRARTLDMLAGKIVRSMTDKYKPTDIIDIYNIIKGHKVEEDKPLKDMTVSADSEYVNPRVETLRALIVAYIPMSRGLHAEDERSIRCFEDTPETKQRFLERVEGDIAAHRMQQLRDNVDDIFATINETLRAVMGPRDAVDIGPLHLTAKEKAFISEIEGRQFTPEEKKAPEGGITLFGKTFFSRKVTQREAEEVRIEPRVNVRHLMEEHPEAFERYPELEKNIAGSAILSARVMENKYGPAPHHRDIPIDF